MPEFLFSPMFVPGPDPTDYRLLTKDHVSIGAFEGREIVKVAPRRSLSWPRRRSRKPSSSSGRPTSSSSRPSCSIPRARPMTSMWPSSSCATP